MNLPKVLWIVAGVVVLWLAGSEISTQAWYHTQESKLPLNPLPKSPDAVMERLKAYAEESGSAPAEKGIGDAAMEILKCSYGKTLMWVVDGAPMAVTILKWSDRSVVSGVEGMHNPGNCLRAAGWKIGKRTDYGVEEFGAVSADVVQWEVTRGNLNMLAYSAVFRRFAEDPTRRTSTFWAGERFLPVMAGRRDSPVYILLAYLPIQSANAEAQVYARFDRIIKESFQDSVPVAKGP